GGGEIAQRVDIVAAVERLAPDTAAIAAQPSAADVGVERAELDPKLRGSFVRGDHAGTFGFARRHRDYHAIAGRRASSRRRSRHFLPRFASCPARSWRVSS